MALASVLSIQLGLEPHAEDLQKICAHINSKLQKEPTVWPLSEFSLVAAVLRSIASGPTNWVAAARQISHSTPNCLSATHMLWLSRIMLQMVWRWRRIQGPAGVLLPYGMWSIRSTITAGDNPIPVILRINCFLTVAISLGLQPDIRDLYAPGTK